jgi:uncharacterized protein (TIGR00369 family)
MSMSTAVTIESGPWAGWKTWPQDKFETGIGPFYSRKDENGRLIARFIAEDRHMNGGGFMHGGCFLTFADFACFAIADEVASGPSVTVNLSGDFLSSARAGDMMEATGEVTRAGGRLIYVRGLITANGKPALSFTSVITRVTKSHHASSGQTDRSAR